MKTIDMTSASPAAFERIGLHEGSIGLPPGFEDRSANLFVPADPQKQPNLSIARDWLGVDEALASYVDRQLRLQKSRLPSHKLIARIADRLGHVESGLIGERVEAHYMNGKQKIRQRQAAFLIAPRRALILTAASSHPFDEHFEALWRGWLDSFMQPPSASSTADAATAVE